MNRFYVSCNISFADGLFSTFGTFPGLSSFFVHRRLVHHRIDLRIKGREKIWEIKTECKDLSRFLKLRLTKD